MKHLSPLETALRQAETEAYRMAERQAIQALELAKIKASEYSPEIKDAVKHIADKVAEAMGLLEYREGN